MPHSPRPWRMLTASEMVDFPHFRQYDTGKSLVFIHINKTGGSSLRKYFGLPPEASWIKKYRKHYPYKQLLKLIPKPFIDTAITAAFVRNPWDRLVSLYYYRKKRLDKGEPIKNTPQYIYNDFDSWLAYMIENDLLSQYHTGSQLRWVQDKQRQVKVDFIGRFERLSEDAADLAEQLGITAPPLAHLNNSAGRGHYRNYYNSTTAEQIATIFAYDIAQFGYVY